MKQPPTHRPNIDKSNVFFGALESLRGLAALLVVFYHFSWSNPFYNLNIVRNGYMMVDLFFILSGFVIFHSYGQRLQTPFDIKKFMILRIGRLYPVHLVFLCVFLIFEIIKFFLSSKAGFVATTSPFSQNTISLFISNLFLTQSISIHDHLGYNQPSWSIGAEFMTYVVFALLIYTSKNQRKFLLFSALIVLFSLLTLFSINKPNLEITYDFGLIRCFLGFFCGVLIYKIYLWSKNFLNKNQHSLLTTISIVTLFFFLFIFLLINKSGKSDYLIFFLVGPIFILLAGAPNNIATSLFLTKPFQILGEISYSIYMSHTAIIYLISIIAKKLLHPATIEEGTSILLVVNNSQGLLISLIALTLTLLISYLSFKYIENPCRLLSKKLVNIYADSEVIKQPLKYREDVSS